MFKSFYIVCFSLLIFSVTGCGDNKAGEPSVEADSSSVKETHDADVVEFTTSQYNAVGVKLGTISYANLSNYIKASGIIDVPPQQTVSITAPYGGIVRSTTVIEGKFIAKGQVVATLENPEFIQLQQDYVQSSSQLTFLKQDLDRQEQLVKENIAARKSLQRASSEYNSVLASVEGFKAKLRQININPESLRSGTFSSRVNLTAPISGYITKVYTNAGKYLNANESIAEIVDTKNMYVNVKVFEKDVPKIAVGQRIRFQATGDSAERVAELFLIGKDIDADRTVGALGRIRNPAKTMLPGMFVNSIIEVGSSSEPALPEEAIVQAGGKNYIFVLLEDSDTSGLPTSQRNNSTPAEKEGEIAFRRVEVSIGVTENGITAVTVPESFNKQSKIVIKGAYDLLSKMNNSEEEEGH